MQNKRQLNESYGRGFIVLLAGGGILLKPQASKTGSSSLTRPGILPSGFLEKVFFKHLKEP